MSIIEKEKYFLEYLAGEKNKKQNCKLLEFIDKHQYKALKQIACNVLEEVIPLDVKQYIILVPHKNFIRKLGKGKVSKSLLVKNCKAVTTLVKIALEHYASHAKVSTGTNRRVGENKRKKLKRKEASSDSESTYSESSDTSTTHLSDVSEPESPESIYSQESEESNGFGKVKEKTTDN